jgi:AraC-like DNA-binding protein
MGTVCTVPPATQLRRCVDRYVYLDVAIPVHVTKPLSPRETTVMTFDLDDRHVLFLEYRSGAVAAQPKAAVLGPMTHRSADIRGTGHYRGFIILFRSTGYYRLFGIRPAELADRVLDARDVAGAGAGRLHDRLRTAGSMSEMKWLADQYLLSRVRTVGELHPVHRIAETLIESGGCSSLLSLACHARLSTRQMERKFIEQLGMTAKRYARILRFRNALRQKAENPILTWTDVSHLTGYYDQTHLVKEFRELVHATPSTYLRQVTLGLETEMWSAAPLPEVAFLLARQFGSQHKDR